MFKKKIVDAVLAVADNPEKNVTRWRVELDRAEAKVTDLRRQLDEATSAVALAEQAVGLAMAEGLAADSAPLNLAKDRVGLLRLALHAAERKKTEATHELNQADLALAIDQEEQALAHLKFTVAPKVDALFAALETLIEDSLIPAMAAAKAASGDGVHLSGLTDASMGFSMMLDRATKAILPRGRAVVPLLNGRKFSDLCPDPSTVAIRRRAKA